ncbi:MAG: hypothetical protein M1835_000852 [Candelina submexicana]|nr:MAG: hypothetical protein M1835_000852 [Candelina submexicana]
MAPCWARHSSKKSSWGPLASFLWPVNYALERHKKAQRKAEARSKAQAERNKATENRVRQKPAAQSNFAPVIGHIDDADVSQLERTGRKSSEMLSKIKKRKEKAPLRAAGRHPWRRRSLGVKQCTRCCETFFKSSHDRQNIRSFSLAARDESRRMSGESETPRKADRAKSSMLSRHIYLLKQVAKPEQETSFGMQRKQDSHTLRGLRKALHAEMPYSEHGKEGALSWAIARGLEYYVQR